MNRRGFTLMELLAAITVASIALVVLASAVRSQGTSAVFQMGSADMQQNVRGALDLFRREVRMAGYGMGAVEPDVLPIVQVPAPGAGELYRVNLYGNYDFVKARVTGGVASGATVIPLVRYSAAACLGGSPAKTFIVNERVALESAFLGAVQVRTIASYDAVNCTVTVTPAVTEAFEAGSPVNEIEEITYRLDENNVLWREGVVMADRIDTIQIAYILKDGTAIADPSADLGDLRSATINMHSQMTERRDLRPQAEMQTEVRIRNLDIVRSPALDNL